MSFISSPLLVEHLQISKKHKWLIVIAVVVLIGVAYYIIDPVMHKWVPKCPFLLLTGWKCPGCGSQRAIHALVHGDIIEVFRQNALFLPSIAYIISIVASRLKPSLHDKLTGQIAIWTYFGIIIVFWISRNIFGF